jgi:hypothetical protein
MVKLNRVEAEKVLVDDDTVDKETKEKGHLQYMCNDRPKLLRLNS